MLTYQFFSVSSPEAPKLSPTKTLIQKFNSLNEQPNSPIRNIRANPLDCNTPSPSGEPMYATIGSKNRSQIASRKV